MELLKITWIRIIISGFAGSIITEILHINTGNPNRPRGQIFSILQLVFGIAIYKLITWKLRASGKIE